jgi:serine phosphatase RsbU (regulator of sigma subunit)
MPPVPIHSDAFAQAALASERVRVIGLLWSFAALAAVATARIFFTESGAGFIVAPTLALIGAAAAYEAGMLRMINRRLGDGRPVQDAVWRINIAVETLLPTLAIVILADSGLFTPRQALVAPTMLIYFFLIVLSTLRLSPQLSRLTGVSAAAGYMAAVAFVYWRHPAPITNVDFAIPVYATYAAFLLIGGFIAGAVAVEIRKHVAAALREADTRAQKDKLEHDLGLARAIQQGLLPLAPPPVERFEVAGWNQPADQTGGDYYDWRHLTDGRVVVVLADVTGHGVGPALMAAACRAYERASLPGDDGLGRGMSRMNDLLAADLPPGKLVTLVTALVDPPGNRVELLSAGHGPLMFFTAADGRVQRFDAHGVPFGVMSGIPYGPPQTLFMEPGDLLLLVTDGFFEWANADGEQFGIDRLERTIRVAAGLAPDQIIARMHADVRSFADGAPQADDLTVVIVKRTA